MKAKTFRASTIILWIGDVIALGLVTILGFASHGELGSAGVRMLTTFVPLVFAWIIAAGPGDSLEVRNAVQFSQIWRPVWAMCLAVPLATVFRASLLAFRPISPIFVFVLAGVGVVAILTWRILFFVIFRKKKNNP